MIKGIGVDIVNVQEIQRLDKDTKGTFILKTFTENEIRIGNARLNKYQYFASRFAVKEAVFKSLAHLTKNKTFDMRIIETLNYEDGMPYVVLNLELKKILNECCVEEILVSISDEDNYAIAYVIVQ